MTTLYLLKTNDVKFKLFNYFYLPIAVCLIIFYLCCFISNNNIPAVELTFPLGIQIDKLVHFCMYFGLSIAASFNYIRINKGNINIYILLIGVFLIPILYGGFIEIVQHYYCEGRSGEWDDFFADLIGSLAALPFVLYYRHYWLTNKEK